MNICEKVTKKWRESGPEYEHLRKSQKKWREDGPEYEYFKTNGENVVQNMNISKKMARRWSRV